MGAGNTEESGPGAVLGQSIQTRSQTGGLQGYPDGFAFLKKSYLLLAFKNLEILYKNQISGFSLNNQKIWEHRTHISPWPQTPGVEVIVVLLR